MQMRLLTAHPVAAQSSWVRQFGTSRGDQARAVAADADANVYVAGVTDGILPGQSSAGSGDAFVRKYDPSGNELWTRQFGTAGDDEARAVAVDAGGNVYVAGFTDGTFPGQSSAGAFADAFVRKYDAAGNELWTRQFGTSGADEAVGVAVDAGGDVYVAGATDAAFPGQTSAGFADAFVRKYDAAGNELWTRQFGTAGADEAVGVAVDQAGNVCVAGITFGTFPGQASHGYAGVPDAFVRKYDAAGNELWTRQFGTSSGHDAAFAVAVDAGANVYVAGFTFGTVPGQVSSGAGDAFVRKYDATGNEVWTRKFGRSSADEPVGVSVDAGGNVYVAGFTTGSLPGQTSAGHLDAFVAKIPPEPVPV